MLVFVIFNQEKQRFLLKFRSSMTPQLADFIIVTIKLLYALKLKKHVEIGKNATSSNCLVIVTANGLKIG